jgi:deoxyribodipyrimidine photo-lyase
MARAAKASAVVWNELAQAPHLAIAKTVEAELAKAGIDSQSFPGDLLASPRDIRNKDGRGLRVFTPFWRSLQALGEVPAPLPAPKRLPAIAGIASETLEDWKLEPRHPDWAGALRESWTPGEAAAQQRLRDFLADGLTGYAGERDRPDRDGASALSPHLRFGEISPRQIGHAARFVSRCRQIPERARLTRVLPAPAL